MNAQIYVVLITRYFRSKENLGMSEVKINVINVVYTL